jgi:hypothetical protein
MNDKVPAQRFDGYLQFLERAIVLARAACQRADSDRGEALLDAVHNLPRFLAGGEHGEFEENFHAHYLEPLVRRYPDLQGLADACPRP